MSINHYYSNSDLPEAHHWWSQYMNNNHSPSSSNNNHNYFLSHPPIFPKQNDAASSRPAAMFNLNSNEDEEDRLTDEQENSSNIVTAELEENEEIPKMPLFEKPLTPSDVGKLNRLVIPKQHAEKYFPLNGAGAGDSVEKGLLLSFEDEIGKSWRFRYSYWNSSQSYVLTKGWSRFVKEKRLDAGDIVLFSRHRIDAGRLFIGWRRRNSEQDSGVAPPPAALASGGAGGGWNRMFYSSYGYSNQHQAPSSQPYQANCTNAGTVMQKQTRSSGNPKRVRLFGVNLECHADESSTSDGSPMSTQAGQTHPAYHRQYYSNNHMDISFSGGGGDNYRQG